VIIMSKNANAPEADSNYQYANNEDYETKPNHLMIFEDSSATNRQINN
jgi:hypothetical protein